MAEFLLSMSVLSQSASLAADAALALVYPQACEVCGGSVESRHDGVACSGCWDDAWLFHGDESWCGKCGAVSTAQASDQRETVRCGQCDMDTFTAARACGVYEGAFRAAVLELKRQPHIARPVAQPLY